MHLPVTIEVGKHLAIFFTVLLICETHRTDINIYKKKVMWIGNKKLENYLDF